ncbi:hypothetical protein CXF86_19370 [Shewanella sp. GutCb]|uniref:hypothetical protein n=1 Tax=Shewanella sp. GutCb TaxID=2058315 RepID=UPI000C7E5030|nr:hypothetical protein [Shewanella sp. GutCb]PKG73123.1 hypothetical protein CXF86_19370 [Shewanella sp. GutCb]
MTDITTPTFRSNFKKLSRHIQTNNEICYKKAQDIAAKQFGFPSYHALGAHRNRINNESNIVNANLGTDGVNEQYAKAQGNRGKQLNPNQQSSLIVAFDNELIVRTTHIKGDEFIFTEEDFQTEYLDKGFAEEIGARLISREELKRRDLPWGEFPDPEAYRLHQCGLTCIEFLRDKDTPWTKSDADKFLHEKFYSKNNVKYYDTCWLDGKPVRNHIGDDSARKMALPEPLEYCPAIDGY